MTGAAGRRARVMLAGNENARALDREAAAWGLDSIALVEAAGRSCAGCLARSLPEIFDKAAVTRNAPALVVLAGSGNNAADALVMLRTLVIAGYADGGNSLVLIKKLPGEQEISPFARALKSARSLDIPVLVWEAGHAEKLGGADIIIDGIAGTGLSGPLNGGVLEMARAAARARENSGKTRIAALDIPSGIFDGWKPGMPALKADLTLAVEPRKICLYTPAARPYAGRIVPVENIFPPALIEKYGEAELLDWKKCAQAIPRVKRSAYKYERGLVEIHAGSAASAGAAALAARGSQAAGAGLVRLIVDTALYPVLAVNSGGIMVAAEDADAGQGRFSPDAVLLGPGWGSGAGRLHLLESFLPLEEKGVPLILDADAISLARGMVFHGNTIITPHPGELSCYEGVPREDILADPVPVLRACAAGKNVHILFKSHVLYIVSPQGRAGIIDGMNPVLAAGGSGDVLAGFCAAIAGRMYAQSRRGTESADVDLFACAAAAAALLLEAGNARNVRERFVDPAEIADAASGIAGDAWLEKETGGE